MSRFLPAHARQVSVARGLFDGLLDLLVPRICPLCERDLLDAGLGSPDDPPWHPGCWRRLNPRPHLMVEDRPLWAGVPVFALLDDTPDWFRLLHRAKYGGQRELSDALGRELARAVSRGGGVDPETVVVPLPDDPDRRRRRGYGPVARLALALAGALGLPCRDDLLRRRRGAVSQTTLDDDLARADNVRGVFRTGDLGAVPARARLLLIEDQVTSGATVSDALGRLGARGHGVAVLAVARARRVPERVHP